VHSNDYVEFVYGLHEDLAAMAKHHCKEADGVLAVALTPRVQRHVYRLAEMDVKSDRYCDTSFSEGSLHAATRSAGAVCHAIDKVC
jgi:acetoin utilization deacetylase AcuC-like enzyme